MVESPSTITVRLDESWTIGDKIHGGYLASEIARAALDGDQPHPPFIVNVHYLSAADPGEGSVHVETTCSLGVLRQMRAHFRQRNEVIATALVATADPGSATSAPYFQATDGPPALPPVGECVSTAARTPGGARLGIAEHLELRWDPATVGWLAGKPSRAGRVAGWIRRIDEQPMDLYWLLIVGDSAPPLTFDFGIKGWTPTVSLVAHVYAYPSSGWLRAEQTSELIGDGWLDETCNVWDSTSRLVASVRQLASYQTD